MSSKKANLNTSGNTLFNYFARSPSTPKADKSVAKPAASPLTSKPITPTSSKQSGAGKSHRIFYSKNRNFTKTSIATAARAAKQEPVNPKKKKLELDSDDDEEEIVKVKGKRKIACIIDTDSDSDYKNDENESENGQKMDTDDVKASVKKKSANGSSAGSKKIKLDSANSKQSFEEKLQANIDESRSLSDVKETDTTDLIDVPVVYRHNTLKFLTPEEIRDGNKKRPSDPNYDPTTLYVPKEYLDSLTPVSIATNTN